jgi:hypothetical protein
VQVRIQVDPVDEAIIERELDLEAAKQLHRDDRDETHAPLLFQGGNGVQRLQSTSAFPVLEQFRPVQTCPLGNEPQRSGREFAPEQSDRVDTNGGPSAPVRSVEMG